MFRNGLAHRTINMKLAILSLFFFGTLVSATPINVAFLNPGNPGVVSNGVFVGPYTLSLNGVTTPAMCMDDFLEVYNNDTWTVNSTNAASKHLENTYLGNKGASILGYSYTSSQIYTAEAYLFSLITKPGADRIDIQEAAWAIMDPAAMANVFIRNNTGVEAYLTDAQNHYSTFDASGYSIISQTGRYSNASKQEFMVASAPEPATFVLLGSGLFAAGAARFLRRRKTQIKSEDCA